MNYSKEILRKVTQYLQDKLGMTDYRNGWMKGTCPKCAKELKFGVNIEKNRSNCFSCGYTKKPLWIIGDLEGIDSYYEILTYLNAFDGADYLETPKEFLKEATAELPEGYNLITLGDNLYGRAARRYLQGRGFDLTELMLKGVGYCRSGRYKGRIIIPYYEMGKIVYFNARQYMGGGAKFDNPTIANLGVGKSMLLYNIDALQVFNKIYITESATNSMTLGDNAIGAGGKALSTYQISKIIQSPAKKMVIILDPDAWEEAIVLALKLSYHKKVKLVKLPPKLYRRSTGETIVVDVNAIGKKKTKDYEKQSPWLTYSDVMKIKMEYERAEFTRY